MVNEGEGERLSVMMMINEDKEESGKAGEEERPSQRKSTWSVVTVQIRTLIGL